MKYIFISKAMYIPFDLQPAGKLQIGIKNNPKTFSISRKSRIFAPRNEPLHTQKIPERVSGELQSYQVLFANNNNKSIY